MSEPVTVWITTNSGKFLKRWEYQTTWPASWEISMQVKKQQLELDMKKQIGSKSGKEYIKAVYYHPAYLTYISRYRFKKLTELKEIQIKRKPYLGILYQIDKKLNKEIS